MITNAIKKIYCKSININKITDINKIIENART